MLGWRLATGSAYVCSHALVVRLPQCRVHQNLVRSFHSLVDAHRLRDVARVFFGPGVTRDCAIRWPLNTNAAVPVWPLATGGIPAQCRLGTYT